MDHGSIHEHRYNMSLPEGRMTIGHVQPGPVQQMDDVDLSGTAYPSSMLTLTCTLQIHVAQEAVGHQRTRTRHGSRVQPGASDCV